VVVLGRPDDVPVPVPLGRDATLAVGVLVVVVALMATGIVPAAIAALLAAVALVALSVVPASEAYRAISWRSVIFIAAFLPMGVAPEKTGAAEQLAETLVQLTGDSKIGLLAVVFIAASALSQIMSNTATAIVLAPVVLQAAVNADASPRPIAMTLAVAVTTGILSPAAGAPLVIVQQPGGYVWGDYVRFGGPLVLILLALTLVAIPVCWSL
jgi:di/tricarboxylate transporter